MSVSYARFYLMLALFLPLLKGSDAWEGGKMDQGRVLGLCRSLINDLARKGQAVWMYREVYQRYVSYAVGERVYVIRAKFAQMLRSYLRNEFKYKKYAVNDMIRNALMLQKSTQMMYDFRDELIEFDLEIMTSANYLNQTRFGYGNCQIAGPPCDISPQHQLKEAVAKGRKPGREGRRRSSNSKKGPIEQILQLMDARRNFIKMKYKENKFPRPINMNAEINRTIDIKRTTIAGSGSQNSNADLVDLAPDFID